MTPSGDRLGACPGRVFGQAYTIRHTSGQARAEEEEFAPGIEADALTLYQIPGSRDASEKCPQMRENYKKKKMQCGIFRLPVTPLKLLTVLLVVFKIIERGKNQK